MKTHNPFLIIIFYATGIIAQVNIPSQLTNFNFDSRNPAFIDYPQNEPGYSQPGEIFFEAHTDSSINIYAMRYIASSDSFSQPYPITQGNFKNTNVVGGIYNGNNNYKIILWETNQRGNLDISFSKDYGSGFSEPELFFPTDGNERSPSIVMMGYYYYEEFNIVYTSGGSVYIYTKRDTSETNFLLFEANDSTKYSKPVGAIAYDESFEEVLYIVAVEEGSNMDSHLVYKKRLSVPNTWSEPLSVYQGYPSNNPKFVDPYFPFQPTIYLNFEIEINGKTKSVLLSTLDFTEDDINLIYVQQDSTTESSEFDAYSFYIVTDGESFESWYPYAYKLNDNDSTFIISGASEYYNQEYRIFTKFDNSKVTIGPLAFKDFGIISYTVWEDSSDSGINLFGLKRVDILGDVKDKVIADRFSLSQNYPNPFNPNTSIQYSVSSRQFVTLKVYDVLGREVVTLVNEEKHPGVYEAEFNATKLSSGVYYYQLKAGDFVETKKMMVVK